MNKFSKLLFGFLGIYPARAKKYFELEDLSKKYSSWIHEGRLAPPPPAEAKLLVLERHHIPGAVWIETGTFQGNTTRFLSELGSLVISLEPADFYFQQASKSLAGFSNIKLIKGSSEEFLEKVLKDLAGKDVCLWLDGHWSGGETWKGQHETPVLGELATIEKHLGSLAKLVVMIDDYRLCWTSPLNYPKPSYYIEWAERNSLSWFVEQDIFIAKSPMLHIF